MSHRMDGGLADSPPDGDGAAPRETGGDRAIAADGDAGPPPRVLAGACLEGMECSGNDPGGSPVFSCHCIGGTWVCPRSDSQGWLDSDLPLPSTNPQDGTACNGSDYVCNLPDHCGSLCVCARFQWQCKTVTAGPDGGPQILEGVPDPGAAGANSNGCEWPPCSSDGGILPVGAQCLTVECSARVLPSGLAIFVPGASGCSVEH